jgi:hypothetical protein
VVTVSSEEQAAYRDWLSLSLIRAPEATLTALVQAYSPVKVREAKQWITLAATLSSPPEEEPLPDGPGPACAWCGRTSPPAGLKDETIPGSKPEYACRGHWEECNRARQARLAKPPARVGAAPLAPHQRVLAEELKRRRDERLAAWRVQSAGYRETQWQRPGTVSGYHGQAFEHEPAWLTPLREDAEELLLSYGIVHDQVSAWVELASQVDEGELTLELTRVKGSDGAAAVPPLTPPFCNPWAHTIAGGAHIGHLISGQGAAWAAGAHGGVSHPQEPTHPQGWEKMQDGRRGGGDPRSRKRARRRHYLMGSMLRR